MTTTTAKANVKSCSRCGNPIAKGEPVEMFGTPVRMVHVGCSAPVVEVADLTVETVREMMVEQLGEMLENLDLSGLETEVSEVIETRLAEQSNSVETRLGDFCNRMSEATADAVTTALTTVQQMIDAGVPKVHVIQKWDGTQKKLVGHVHELFAELFRDLQVRDDDGNRYPQFIAGPAGCGKTSLARQVAEALDLPFYFISCSAGMSESQLTGRLTPAPMSNEDMKSACDAFFAMGLTREVSATLAAASGGGAFTHQMSQYAKAYENGGVFLLDEVDAADANVMLVVNASLAGNLLALPSRPQNPVAKRHPDFICIAAANTWGRGADRQYVGRTRLDGAFLDRFTQYGMEYDTTLELSICPDLELLQAFHAVREACAVARIERPVSTRQIAKFYHFRSQAGYSVTECIGKFMRGWSKDEITKATR